MLFRSAKIHGGAVPEELQTAAAEAAIADVSDGMPDGDTCDNACEDNTCDVADEDK